MKQTIENLINGANIQWPYGKESSKEEAKRGV